MIDVGELRTPEDVAKAVRLVESLQNDPELAHLAEDETWLGTLQSIAAGAPEAQRMAAEAIRTLELKFLRAHG